MPGNSSLSRAMNKRISMRKQVESLCSKVDTQLDTLTEGKLIGIKTHLEALQANLSSLNDEVLQEMEAADKDDLTMQLDCTSGLDYEMKITDSISVIAVKLATIQSQSSTNNSNSTLNNSINYAPKTSLTSPEVPLPEFSGKETESLEDFISNFESTVKQLTDKQYDMFLWLKRAVTGEAAKLIASVPPSQTAYDCAKAMLEKAYEPTVKRKFRVLENLINAQMSFKDHVYDHFSKLQNLFDAYDRAQIDSKFVKQFFAWRSFTSPLQDSFITVTGKYRPDFDEIENYKFEAADRYKDKQKRFNDRKNNNTRYSNKPDNTHQTKSHANTSNTGSYAANIPGNKPEKPIWCRLCHGTGQQTDHKTFNCQQFPTAAQKIDRIKILGGCIKCGYSNHKKDTCRFTFEKKCRHCEGTHLSWLCLKVKDQEAAKAAASASEVTDSEKDPDSESETFEIDSEGERMNMCSVEAHRACLPSNSILPTFEFKIKDHKFRGMRDSGCQKNFVSADLVKKLGIKSKGEGEITINGFNASKSYKVKLIDLPFEFGSRKFKIETIVLPNLTVSFSASGLGAVAKEFKNKGYILADTSLVKDRDGVPRLDLLLGVDSAHIFKEQTVTFGKDNTSAFVSTPGGVMLVGSSIRMIKNLDYLPDFVKSRKPSSVNSAQLGASALISTNTKDFNNSEIDYGQFIGNERLTEAGLQKLLSQAVGYDPQVYNDKYSELDKDLVDYTLDHT